jgi:hypothetical protein
MDYERNLETHGWADADDAERMAGLRDFVVGLEASGGGDTPEDVAGGLEAAVALFAERVVPSLRMCLLITDAPCHGVGSGDERPHFGGVDQLERTLRAVRALCVDGGAELLLCNAGGGGRLEAMVRVFDGVLGAAGTFVDEFPLEGAAENVFRDKVVAALESSVAAAVAAPTAGLGLDLFAGADFSVPHAIACARFRSLVLELTSGLRRPDDGGDDNVSNGDEGDENGGDDDVGTGDGGDGDDGTNDGDDNNVGTDDGGDDNVGTGGGGDDNVFAGERGDNNVCAGDGGDDRPSAMELLDLAPVNVVHLEVSNEDIIGLFQIAANRIRAVSLTVGYPAACAVPQMLVNSFQNLTAVAVATEINFKQAEEIKDIIMSLTKCVSSAASLPQVCLDLHHI